MNLLMGNLIASNRTSNIALFALVANAPNGPIERATLRVLGRFIGWGSLVFRHALYP